MEIFKEIQKLFTDNGIKIAQKWEDLQLDKIVRLSLGSNDIENSYNTLAINYEIEVNITCQNLGLSYYDYIQKIIQLLHSRQDLIMLSHEEDVDDNLLNTKLTYNYRWEIIREEGKGNINKIDLKVK